MLSRTTAKITDLGAGCGGSTLALARVCPGATVTGIDSDPASVEQATVNAREYGFAGNVSFHVADAVDSEGASQDAVFIFEALHDMPFPVQVLPAVRRRVKSDGVVLVRDEAVADTFAPVGDVLERLMYAYSLFTCPPESLATPDSSGTGTLMRQPLLAEYDRMAGFSRVGRLPLADFSDFRFCRLDP